MTWMVGHEKPGCICIDLRPEGNIKGNLVSVLKSYDRVSCQRQTCQGTRCTVSPSSLSHRIRAERMECKTERIRPVAESGDWICSSLTDEALGLTPILFWQYLYLRIGDRPPRDGELCFSSQCS